MSPITNVVVAAALVLGVGGAVVVGALSEANEPPDVGEPIIIESDQSSAPTESRRTDSSNPSTPTPDGRSGRDDDRDDRGNGDDRDRDRDDDGDSGGNGSGTIDDDDDVDEVFPSPRTLGNDDDGGGDDDSGDDDGDDDGDD